MFRDVIEKFAEQAPATLMIEALLERLLDAQTLDRWFEEVRGEQYTRQLLFSSVLGVMLQVVCRIRSSVHSAYQADGTLPVSVTSFYNKLQGMELSTSRALVQHVAQQASTLIEQLDVPAVLLADYQVKILDGNCLAASEHRLRVLRSSGAAPLPGKALVVYNPQLGVVEDVVPCADGHSQERALLTTVAATIQRAELWLADRNFCVRHFLQTLHQKEACFIIRQHANLAYTPLTELVLIGQSATGAVFEQRVCLPATDDYPALEVRRIVVHLDQPTREGEREIVLLSNLPACAADALQIADLYRRRWRIEGAFQQLSAYFEGEISTLAYPNAALFSFCVALVAFNLYAVVLAALRAAHPTTVIEAEVSAYYLAEELASTRAGLLIVLEEADRDHFRRGTPAEFADLLRYLAARVSLAKFKKHPRGPKKPPSTRPKDKHLPHVSTAKLLAAAAASPAP